MKKATLKELPKIYRRLKNKPVNDVLAWAYNRFGSKLGMTTAFGYSGVVLMHHIHQMKLDIDIYFIDTGYHFPETLQFARKLQKEWKLKVHWLRIDDYLRRYLFKIVRSNKPWKVNPNLCCHYCKVEPFLRIQPKKDAWLSAIRRDQSYTRSVIDTVEIDGRGTFKIYPLAYWTKKQTWDYIRRNKLPYNPLHDKGYMSVGCRFCTSSVKQGGDERDGRWKSTPKLECGIHIHKRDL